MNEVIVYILHTSLVKKHFSSVENYVSEKRREKALRYVNEKDQLLSFGAGYLLKKYLPNEEMLFTESGKPYLKKGPHFNVSHSGEYVVLAIHPSLDVGIDIERIASHKIEGIQFVLNEEEKSIKDVDTLFRIWSNKESLTKCLASGLKDIKNVNGLPLEGMRLIIDECYYVKSMLYDDYSLSVTLKGKEPFNININQVNILEN